MSIFTTIWAAGVFLLFQFELGLSEELEVKKDLAFDETCTAPQNDSKLQDDIIEHLTGPRSHTRNFDFTWDAGVVPFEFSEDLDAEEKEVLSYAMRYVASRSCVRFLPRKDQTDFIRFIEDSDGICGTLYGRKGGMQEIEFTKGVCSRITVVRLLLRTLGIFPEHQRSNRDAYVNVYVENAVPERIPEWFDKRSQADDVFRSVGFPYDFASLLHFARKRFSNNKLDTVVPLRNHVLTGRYESMSRYDVLKLGYLYQCEIAAVGICLADDDTDLCLNAVETDVGLEVELKPRDFGVSEGQTWSVTYAFGDSEKESLVIPFLQTFAGGDNPTPMVLSPTSSKETAKLALKMETGNQRQYWRMEPIYDVDNTLEGVQFRLVNKALTGQCMFANGGTGELGVTKCTEADDDDKETAQQIFEFHYANFLG